jgi:hypothetical protein
MCQVGAKSVDTDYKMSSVNVIAKAVNVLPIKS